MKIDDIAARLSQRAAKSTTVILQEATVPSPTVSIMSVNASRRNSVAQPSPLKVASDTVSPTTIPTLPKLPFPFSLTSGLYPTGTHQAPDPKPRPVVPNRLTTALAAVPGFLSRPTGRPLLRQEQPRSEPRNVSGDTVVRKSDSLSSFGSAVSLHCGIPGCKLDQQSVHFHCSFERCLFVSRAIASITAHLSSFHSLGPIQNHLMYIHADSSCPEKTCSVSGESHFHCHTCGAQFFSGNSQLNKSSQPSLSELVVWTKPRETTRESNNTQFMLKPDFPNSNNFKGFTSHDRLASHLRKHQRADLRQAAAAGTALSSTNSRSSRHSVPVPFSLVSAGVPSQPPIIPTNRPTTVIRHTTTVIGPLGIHPEMLRLLQRGPENGSPGIAGPGNRSRVIVREIEEAD